MQSLQSIVNESSLILLLVYIGLVSATLLHMLYQRRSPQNLTTWLLTLIFLPYLGVLLYLLFGFRKSFSKRHKAKITQNPMAEISQNENSPALMLELDKLMNANHISGTTTGNHIELVCNDVEAFNTFMKHLNQAQHSICLETYVFECDATGQAIINALTEKAKQGVKVKLLMDAIGSYDLYRQQTPLQPLQNAGGEYAFFQPVWPNIISNQVNLRNHRKIYLFDENTLITGGVNISDDYFGQDPNTTRWLDLMFAIKGPACKHYQTIFNEDWGYTRKTYKPNNSAINTEHNAEHNTQNIENAGQQIVQAIPSGPDIDSDTLYEALLLAIHNAKNSIAIATPYFIPNNNVMNALAIAVKRGVKVKLLTPTKSDHWIFDFGRSSYMRELNELGGDVRTYSQNMLHAKLIIFDNNLVMSGSANFDYRSLFINYEMVNFLSCSNTIEQLDNWFNQLFNNADSYQAKNTRMARFIENTSRIVAPVL